MEFVRKIKVIINKMSSLQIGDQIPVGKYTATCQKVTDQGAIFILDSYLDKPYQMNVECTNEGGYEASDLRRNLVADFSADENFDSIRDHLTPFKNGDIVRIPTIAEFFGHDNSLEKWFEMDNAEQWELMKNGNNRVAKRKDEIFEWGWLENKVKELATRFAYVRHNGDAGNAAASGSLGVRPVFMIRID